MRPYQKLIIRTHLITGEIKNRIDSIWDAFWNGGHTDSKTIIEDAPFRDYDWFNTFGQNLIYVKKYIDDIHSLIA